MSTVVIDDKVTGFTCRKPASASRTVRAAEARRGGSRMTGIHGFLAVASLTALGIAGFGGIAQADSSSRPLHGNFASSCSGSGTCDTFAGQLAHLGNFTGEITGFTPYGLSSCTEAGAAGCTTATWTAANGDTVSVSSVFYITGSDSSTGLYTFSQSIQIGGGTGRFTDATGAATATGETSGNFSTYYGNIGGTIAY
jgi:hypothetical protein